MTDYFHRFCSSAFFQMILKSTYGPAHNILVFVAYAQMPLLNPHPGILSKARGLDFGPSIHLHPLCMPA